MTDLPPADSHIQELIDLISNTVEAYTTALFLAPSPDGDLKLYAYQSLSQNINRRIIIGPGEGLIGWVHRNNKPINVDQFDRDTRNLLLYNQDEAIKSFMAVPLPKVHGVLVADSKQRYVFTEKSVKILNQFSKALETALARQEQAGQGLRLAGAMAFLTELERILGNRPEQGPLLDEAMALVRHYSKAAAAMLATPVYGDPEHYFLAASDPETNLHLPQDVFPLDMGLAGWILQKRKSLILEKARLSSERSFIFHPEESLKKLNGFFGLPIIYGRRLRGALLLAGEDSFQLDQTQSMALEKAAGRIGANLEIEVLFQRVSELGRLDPQVGLPHRTYFSKRLSRMMTLASVVSSGLTLTVIKLVDLGLVADRLGQAAAQEVLKTAARHLLGLAQHDFELGHLSYGVLALAVSGKYEAEARLAKMELATKLTNLPLTKGQGQVNVEFKSAEAKYPAEASTAERLIHLALTRLALKTVTDDN